MRKILSSIGQHPIIPKKTVARQFIKFAMVGVVNTIIDYGVYALLVLGFETHYLVANIFSFFAAASNSYFLNRRWTFRSNDPRWRRQAVKYFSVLTIGFALNELFLYLFVEHGDVGKLQGKAIAIVIVLFWNFGANKFWTFPTSPTRLP